MNDSFRAVTAEMALDRALRYPYALPKCSYLFYRGEQKRLNQNIDAYLRDKIPVLAFGSNAAVEALDRKFRDFDELYSDPIPVLFGCIRGYAIAYSAQFSPYGALPATITPFEGGMVQTYMTLLSEKQLERMHDTEDLGLYYSFERFVNAFEFGGHAFDCHAYVALGGTLTPKGEPLGLKAVEQKTAPSDRPLTLLSQIEAQTIAIELLGLDMSVEQFIIENALNETLRNARFERLSKIAGDIWQL